MHYIVRPAMQRSFNRHAYTVRLIKQKAFDSCISSTKPDIDCDEVQYSPYAAKGLKAGRIITKSPYEYVK